MDVRVGPLRRWAVKNWHFWTMVLEKTLESPLDSKEIKLASPKGNQPWIFIGRTDAEAPILWPRDAKSVLIGKDPDAEKDWGQEEKGAIEDDMAGWHHRLNGHESDQTPRDSDRQGSLMSCNPWGHKESDMTEWLKNNNTVNESWLELAICQELYSMLFWVLLLSRFSCVGLCATPWTAAYQAPASMGLQGRLGLDFNSGSSTL